MTELLADTPLISYRKHDIVVGPSAGRLQGWINKSSAESSHERRVEWPWNSLHGWINDSSAESSHELNGDGTLCIVSRCTNTCHEVVRFCLVTKNP
jgi:hypothetical protein